MTSSFPSSNNTALKAHGKSSSGFRDAPSAAAYPAGTPLTAGLPTSQTLRQYQRTRGKSRPPCRWTMMASCIVVLLASSPAFARTTCLDGGVALTIAVYESGDRAALDTVTCIPEKGFQLYAGAIKLDGLPLLKDIELNAFFGMTGVLIITGAYPKLETIAVNAFARVETKGTSIDLSNGALHELRSIHETAFNYFTGECLFPPPEEMPKVVGCTHFRLADTTTPLPILHGPNETPLTKAMYDAGGANLAGVTCIPKQTFFGSARSYEVTLSGMPQLRVIADAAFYQFPGRLTISGAYPMLQTIGYLAFGLKANDGSHDGSHIDFGDAELSELISVDKQAFSQVTVSFPPPTMLPKYVGCTTLTVSTITLHGPAAVPLTRALYESGEQQDIDKATCIPDYEFQEYDGNVAIEGLPELTYVGAYAFEHFGGKGNSLYKLTFTGDYPELKSIGEHAFHSLTTAHANSIIQLAGLPLLVDIGKAAFKGFSGTLHIDGKFPLLESIGTGAFNSAGGEGSSVEFTGLPSLVTVHEQAFQFCRARLTIHGEYPMLSTIGTEAFQSVARADQSAIEFNGLPSLRRIEVSAFEEFVGRIILAGEYPRLAWIDLNAFQEAGNAESLISMDCTIGPDFEYSVGTIEYPKYGPFDDFLGFSNISNIKKACATTTTTTTTTSLTTSTATTKPFTTATATTATTATASDTTAPDTATATGTTIATTATATAPTTTMSRTPLTTAPSPAALPSSKSRILITGLVVALVLLLIAVFALWCFKHRNGGGGGHAIPDTAALNAIATAAVVPNRMYNHNPADAVGGGSSSGSAGVPPTVKLTPNVMYAPGGGSGSGGAGMPPTVKLTPNVMYAPHTGTEEAQADPTSTIYSIPMEADQQPEAEAGAGAAGGPVYAQPIEPGSVMYVSVLNQDDPQYATAAATDALYSVVSRAPDNGQGNRSGATAAVSATPGGGGNNHYDVGVPRRRGDADKAEDQNNHYDVGVPRRRQDVNGGDGDDDSTMA